MIPSQDETKPKIIVGVPGRWKDQSDLVMSIAQKSSGYLFAGRVMMHPGTKEAWEVSVQGHDPGITRSFEVAGRGRVSETLLHEIAGHSMVAYLIGEGGSQELARSTMHATAALLDSGGLAAKVETAGVAHTPDDWRALTVAEPATALYYAYVQLVGGNGQFYSCGMQNLGLSDALVDGNTTPQEAGLLLQTFLLFTLLENPILNDGETFSVDADSPHYVLHHQPCTLNPGTKEFHNPYGLWVLQRKER